MRLKLVKKTRYYDVYSVFEGFQILQSSAPKSHQKIIKVLNSFRVKPEYLEFKSFKSEKVKGFGNKTPMTIDLQYGCVKLGWVEKKYSVNVAINDEIYHKETHHLDLFNEIERVAIEIEWNNKDPFYHRDLNNLALLHQFECIRCGVIITKASDWLQYGGTTTHFSKLEEFVQAGASRTCPLVVFAIKSSVVSGKRKPLTVSYVKKIKAEYEEKLRVIKSKS